MARERVSKGRELKPTYFVFCEGETEKLYVKFLKQKFDANLEEAGYCGAC